VVDIWSRKVVAWDVEQSESAELAAQLVSRTCLKERIINARSNPGGALRRAGRTEILLEAAGEQRQSIFRIAIPHR